MKKLFTVLALCASVLVASATDTKPAAKKAAKAPIKKECCKKGGDCCKKAGTAAVATKKTAVKKS